MSEQKSIELFSAKELDRYIGEWKDLTDERKEFARNYGEEEYLEGIFNHIAQLIRVHNRAGTVRLMTHVVCNNNPVCVSAGKFVSKYFGLELAYDRRIPTKEWWLVEKNQIEKLCVSRSTKRRLS